MPGQAELALQAGQGARQSLGLGIVARGQQGGSGEVVGLLQVAKLFQYPHSPPARFGVAAGGIERGRLGQLARAFLGLAEVEQQLGVAAAQVRVRAAEIAQLGEHLGDRLARLELLPAAAQVQVVVDIAAAAETA